MVYLSTEILKNPHWPIAAADALKAQIRVPKSYLFKDGKERVKITA